jgi:ABC-2 type transport system ATP-binding protein
MLQRLGLAQALLGEPRYIFLDEPTSGMDPSGVLLFRRLLKEQKDRGSTVILNSHQLDQVEKVCDRVVFVKSGRIESMETMDAGAGLIRLLRVGLSRTSPRPPAGSVEGFKGIAGATLVRDDPFEMTFSVKGDETAAELLRFLIESGHPVIEAVPEESRLERLFVDREPRP